MFKFHGMTTNNEFTNADNLSYKQLKSIIKKLLFSKTLINILLHLELVAMEN